MKPPPPMFPALGYVTASAKPVATAASTAFPPAFMISTPASLAYFDMLPAIACSADGGAGPAAAGLGCWRQPTRGTAPNAARERAEVEICVRTISLRKMGPLGWFP